MHIDEERNSIRQWLTLKMQTGSFSRILVEQLVRYSIERTAHVHCIFDEIGRLEDPSYWRLEDPPSRRPGTKLATQFKGVPLQGLWHQHYFEPRFIAKNLRNDLRSPETVALTSQIAAAINNGENPRKSIYDLVIGGYERRHSSGAMTGEWIVFSRLRNS